MATAPASGSWFDSLRMTWMLKLVESSIGRKLVMACTGLLLTGFLVGHLAGNLLLFVGPKAFDEYAEWLHHQKFLPLAELGLVVLFSAHIYLAFVTALDNRRARKVAYAIQGTKQGPFTLKQPAHNWMFISGSIVLGFMVLHLIDLRFGLRPDVKYSESMYETTVAVLSSPLSRLVYFVGTVVLGFHLSHGISSAFQSLGVMHPKYSAIVKFLGLLLAIGLAAGFAMIPILVPALQH